MPEKNETATFAGGCYWCLEAVYEQVRGVHKVQSGFSGGQAANPSYEEVCEGTTGHAEVVQVTFDPSTVTYRELLEIFFSIHDPTTPNRQGPDVGTQYRSAIYTHTPEQKAEAERIIAELEKDGTWNGIVTQVEPLTTFYPAPAYHNQYFQRNPNERYCSAIVAPKVAKFRIKWAQKIKTAPLAGA